MNEEALNLSVRKFLKKVGITAQREIEAAVREGIESGKLTGNESLKAVVKLEVEGVDVAHQIDGEITLE
ncbi:hypothetical protein GH984_06515 [Spiribacter sp. C176]|uniref:Uncharacterized protein n=1 Tax=Spiribacter salilacus TaxID=2664894 RepID=A0A6N7QPL0_9GAMM|nr:DUF6494 family protein [Spiribacter salilacus]MRH78356.1 hypothetical protein [Spiribacter salilacus]